MTGLEPFGWEKAIKKAENYTHKIKKVVEQGLDAAAETYVLLVDELAPRSGLSRGEEAYHNTIKVVDAKEGERHVAADSFVTSRSTGITYNLGALLENGTHAHVIEPILASVLFFDGIFTMHVDHPGTPPQPHFAPAIPLARQKFPNLFNTLILELWK